MFTLKRILVAWAATALVAAAASAGDYWADEAPPRVDTKVRAVRYNAEGRKVTVWRDLNTAAQESPDPNNPFDAPDRGEYTPDTISSSSPGTEPSYEGPAEPQWASGCDDCAGLCSWGDGCACLPFWAHRTGLWGEYLYLRPTGVDVAHAIQQTSVIGGNGPTPSGDVFTIQPIFTSAYRAGFAVALSECSSVAATYTNFSSHVADTIEAPDTTSLVLHPNSVNFGTLASFIAASYDIDFQTVDVEYRGLLCAGCRGAVNYAIGARYGKLVQQFRQFQFLDDEEGATWAGNEIKFEGGGLRAGLDGMHNLGATRLSIYAKGFINVLFGQFHSRYAQLDTSTEQLIQAQANWTDNRVVPVLEYEAGLRWTSYNGRWVTSAGYYAAFWFNSVTTPEFIHAVQTSNFNNLGQTVAFDGLVTRLEYRF